jgi:TRAP transporter 4TM/12TM fusion protein
MFGAFLIKTGLGEFFHDISLAIGGASAGGPAKVATIASGMFGSINGAAVANVVTTGTFTIPLMKKVGYDKDFAGAVEASASVGGQILPPIMGAAAFIMAENLGIPYTKIVLAGIIPALLYYFGILSQVDLRAKRFGFLGLSKENLPKLKEVLLRQGYVLFPIFVLVFLLFSGKTVIFAASWSIISIMLISAKGSMRILFFPLALVIIFRHTISALVQQGIWVYSALETQLLVVAGFSLLLNYLFSSRRVLTGKATVEAIYDGIRSTIPVALACACVGIVVGIATLTGVALNVAQFVITIGESITNPSIQLFVTLVLTMVASILLGMGLPSIPTYIITSTMAAPILLGIGAFRDIAGSPELALFIAHMFVFYFGIFANITPPVALAAYAASGISGGNPTTTGYYALKLSLAGFVVPYIFVFSPEILMINPSYALISTILSALLGVYFLSSAIEGYWVIIKHRSVSVVSRLLLGFSSLFLVSPGLRSDLIGLSMAGVALFFILRKKSKIGDSI